MGAALGGLPMHLLYAAVSAGLPLDFRPAELEALLVTRADERRGGGTWRAVPGQAPPVADRPVVHDDAGYRWAEADEQADGTVMAGPSALGAYVRLTLDPSRTPSGPSIAPRAAAFYRFADTHLGTEVGPLGHAVAVR
jgi:hypothetical protein